MSNVRLLQDSPRIFFLYRLAPLNPSTLSLRAGYNHRTGTSDTLQTATVLHIYVHPNYSEDIAPNNDIALLQLEDPGFEFNSHVQPICLPEPNQAPSGRCYTAGWGGTSPYDIGPENIAETLQEAAILVETPQRCKDYLADLFLLPTIFDSETMICTGDELGTVSLCLVSYIDFNTCLYKIH